MRLARIIRSDQTGYAAQIDGEILFAPDTDVPHTHNEFCIGKGLDALLRIWERCRAGDPVLEKDLVFLPPLRHPGKIICVGLNYVDHTAESGYAQPDYPTLFARFPSSLTGHGAPIATTPLSEQLDYEGELAVVIGRAGRNIAEGDALEHVLGYSIFNDTTFRDFQMKTTQWTQGKNFDATGAFGPWLVTADELPAGAAGLDIQTRLNGKVVQSASTSSMIFNVASLIQTLSQFMTLEPGDVVVSGTPAGVGISRTPPLFMKAGDVCEVEIESLGILRNPIVAA